MRPQELKKKLCKATKSIINIARETKNKTQWALQWTRPPKK